MPQGKGTYGSKVGRPPKKKGSLLNDDRERYAEGKDVEENQYQLSKTITLDTVLFEDDKERRVSIRDALEMSRPDSVYAYMQSGNKDWILSRSYGDEGGNEYQSGQMPESVGKRRLEILQSLFNTKDVLSEALPIGTRTKKAEGGSSLLNDDRERYDEGTRAMTQEERKQSILKELLKSINVQVDREDNEYPQKEIDKSYKALVKNSKTVGFSQNEIDSYLQSERERRADERREVVEIANPLGARTDRMTKAEGGDINDQMEGLAISVAPTTIEEEQLPDKEMEADYVDFVVNSTLSEDDKNYLESTLVEDARLSEIFDQVVESASEFSGAGPIEGPGSEVSDSIPARLSDGEFVFTAKATDEIGADNLQRMMEDAEAGAEERQGVVHGGMVEDEGDPKAVPIQTSGSVAAQGNIPNVVKQSRQVEEEMLKSSPRRYYVPVSG
jgi:hypothetical protein